MDGKKIGCANGFDPTSLLLKKKKKREKEKKHKHKHIYDLGLDRNLIPDHFILLGIIIEYKGLTVLKFPSPSKQHHL